MSLPTSKTRGAVRADMLEALLADGRALTVEDVWVLPALRRWNRDAIGDALDQLIADGRLIDDGYGRLHIELEAA